MTPVALEEIPEPDDLPIVETPQIKLPPVPVAAAIPPPEETAIGALTAGGEASPQTKQEAADLIASSEKRLNALSAQKAEEEKAQVSKVKNFLKDAQEALKSGDAEGAKTLATKAKLLLDDLEK
jgi:ribosomal protein S20